MQRRARRRPPGLLLATLMAVLVGLLISVTVIAELEVLATDRPVSAPRGLTYVATDGYRTRYAQWGTKEGTPIVLIHGAFESVHFWEPTARLLGRSHHVEAYDLKGYGYTSHVGPYGTEELARQLSAFLEARHLTHPILVGHSLGAGVIARFVLDHPKIPGGIVFLDGDGLSLTIPGSGLLSWLPDPYRSAVYRSAVRSGLVVRTIFSAACGAGCPPLSRVELREVQRPFEVTGAEDAFFSYATHPIVGVSPEQLGSLRDLHIPSLVIVGSADVELTSEAAREAARRIGAPPPIIIRGAGHLSMWSHPRQVSSAIDAFVGASAHPR